MSNDSFSEVTSESWFSRIMASIKGVAIGLLLFVVAFPLLFLNEGRAVKTHRALSEGQGAVITVQATAVDPANSGKLVHLTGEATTEETLADSTFGVSANAIKLMRGVEMYQWQEKKESKTEKKLGGGTETRTTYNYERKWASSLQNSSEFKQPEGHQNPSTMPHSDLTVTARQVTVGAYSLPPSMVSKIGGATPVPVNDALLAKLPANLKAQAHIQGDALFLGQDPAAPQVGDMRITWKTVPPATVSVAGKQTGNTFEPYTTKNGKPLELLMMGTHSSDGMFEAAKAGNSKLTWILRVIGFLLMAIGLGLVFKPIAVFGDVVPIIGSLLGAGLGLVAGGIALACSLTTISLAWLVYRPLIGVPLLLVAVGAIVGLVMLSKQKKAAAA